MSIKFLHRVFLAAGLAFASLQPITNVYAQDAFCAEGAIVDCKGNCGGTERFDECKLCSGKGKHSYNTAQAGVALCCPPESPAFAGLPDDCGKCGGSGQDKDECGKCFGPGQASIATAQAGIVAYCPPGTDKFVGVPDDCGVPNGGNAKKDSCGKCGGPGVVNGCCPEGTPKFTGNPDSCGVCGGTGGGCCPTFGIKMERNGDEYLWLDSELEGNNHVNQTTYPKCIMSDLITALRGAGVGGASPNETAANEILDENLTTESEGRGVLFFDASCNPVAKGKGEGQAINGMRVFTNVHDKKNIQGDETISVDTNCIAASLGFDSPISLLVGDQTILPAEATLTKFALDPNRPNRWVEWHASDKAPLLVFDPNHTGNITTARQLFGEWTFGGQPYAALLDGSSLQATATPWKNGYEALETLDLNMDGKVAGKELEPLALWFDKNQDAVSQPGEVQAIEKAGVSALFYSDAKALPNGRNLYLGKGYEGSLAGKDNSGTSVDWYARSANTRHELVGELMARDIGVSGDKKKAQEPATHASFKHRPFMGVYAWTDGKEEKSAAQGVLTFREKAPGVITGRSIIEMPLAEEWAKKTGAAFMAKSANLSGTIERKGESLVLVFQVEGQATRTESTITLDMEGKVGKGSSKAFTREQSGEKTALSYTWTAERKFPE
jgi:hypothetical protein